MEIVSNDTETKHSSQECQRVELCVECFTFSSNNGTPSCMVYFTVVWNLSLILKSFYVCLTTFPSGHYQRNVKFAAWICWFCCDHNVSYREQNQSLKVEKATKRRAQVLDVSFRLSALM